MAERAIQRGLKEGREQGLQQGEARLGKLVSALLRDGLADKVALVASDATEREKYYKKYGID